MSSKNNLNTIFRAAVERHTEPVGWRLRHGGFRWLGSFGACGMGASGGSGAPPSPVSPICRREGFRLFDILRGRSRGILPLVLGWAQGDTLAHAEGE